MIKNRKKIDFFLLLMLIIIHFAARHRVSIMLHVIVNIGILFIKKKKNEKNDPQPHTHAWCVNIFNNIDLTFLLYIFHFFIIFLSRFVVYNVFCLLKECRFLTYCSSTNIYCVYSMLPLPVNCYINMQFLMWYNMLCYEK